MTFLSLRVILGTALLTFSQGPASAALYKVGVGAGCTQSTIGDAIGASIGSGEADEIWLTRSVSYVDVALDLGSFTDGITFVGGYDQCNSTTPSGTTTIDGSAAQPIFDIFNSSVIELRNLTLTGAGGTAVEVDSLAQVVVRTTLLEGNGRGASVAGGARLEFHSSVALQNGPIAEGGGVRCEGVGTKLVLNNSDLYENEATEGGGLWAGFLCDVDINTYSVITSNVAEQGGGVFLDDFATVDTSTALLRLFLDHNRAEGFSSNFGGGIYARNGSTFVVPNAVISDNVAEFGGGIYSSGGALVRIERADPCLGEPCVEVSRNVLSASGGVVGAAAYAVGGGDVAIYQAFVEENSDDGENGFPFFAFGSDSTIRLEGVKLWGNKGAALMRLTTNAVGHLAYVSAARNTTALNSDPKVAEVDHGATLEANSSILWDVSGYTLLNGGAVTEADCLISNSFLGIGSFPSNSGADPQFLDADGGDLRVHASSPAIDYCDDSLVTSFANGDIDGEARGVDHPGNPGVGSLGLFDLGFDESFLVFADGFESGDTSRWSASAP